MKHKAFTLIETAIALGIVSFCLLAIAGLTTTSLHTMSDANSDVRATVIAAKVIGEAELSSWQNLDQLNHQVRWFDASGREVPQSEAAYRTELAVTKNKPQGALISPNAAFLEVTITGSALKGQSKHYTSLQANLGR